MGKLPRATKVYRLLYAIEREEQKITAVTLIRPDDATLRSMTALSVPKITDLKTCRLVLAIISDIPPDTIGRLHFRDMYALSKIAMGLLERPPGVTIQ